MVVLTVVFLVFSLLLLACVLYAPRLLEFGVLFRGSRLRRLTLPRHSSTNVGDSDHIEIVIEDLSPVAKPVICRDSVDSLLAPSTESKSPTSSPFPSEFHPLVASGGDEAVRTPPRRASEPQMTGPLQDCTPHKCVAVGESIGRKPTQEDAHLVVKSTQFGGIEVELLVAVFDGHNGSFASTLLREHLLEALSSSQKGVLGALEDGLKRCEALLFEAYQTDPSTSAGSTALIVVVCSKEIYIANLGDCRAVLSRNGVARELTKDQKPWLEKDRILAAGGYLDSEGYINGEIGVGRALGNFHLTDIKHSPSSETPSPLASNPDLEVVPFGADEEFVILASDGLWDVMSNQRAVQIARESLMKSENCEAAVQALLKEAELQETRDNTTAIVVALKSLPLVPKLTPKRSRNPNSRLFRRTSSAPESLPKQTSPEKGELHSS